MKRIPKAFKLMGHTITVRVVNKRDWDAISDKYGIEDAVGYWSPRDQLILIKRGKPSLVVHTFWHEVTHAVLDSLNDKLSNNETFVDNFSGLLAQAVQTFE